MSTIHVITVTFLRFFALLHTFSRTMHIAEAVTASSGGVAEICCCQQQCHLFGAGVDMSLFTYIMSLVSDQMGGSSEAGSPVPRRQSIDAPLVDGCSGTWLPLANDSERIDARDNGAVCGW